MLTHKQELLLPNVKLAPNEFLKCCPFCGARPKVVTGKKGVRVCCSEKHCEIKPKTQYIKSRKDAFFIWNMRCKGNALLGNNMTFSRDLHRLVKKK
jgi:hypothetical protein